MGAVRITGGVARSRVVEVPERPGVRPTSARVREALFSVVGQDLSGQTALDAFGGSGLLGFEAWSRGAAVTVVERDRATAAQVRRSALALGAVVVVVEGDVLTVAQTLGVFDGVMADPPYAAPVVPVLEALARVTRRWLVLEAAASTAVPGVVGGLRRDKIRVFGASALHVFWADGG
jgi:16S rRNA (guanine966-N2)-methyltransferase